MLSVRAWVANLDHPLVHAYRKAQDRLIGRGAQNCTGPEAKSRPMPRADDHVALDLPVRERRTVVCAAVLDGTVLAAEIENGSQYIFYLDDAVLARGEGRHGNYIDPFGPHGPPPTYGPRYL